MTGVNADNAITADRVRAIGEKILSAMTGKSATHYTFKHSSQAVTLAAKSSVRIESDTVQVDLQLLFHRLIVTWNRSDDIQGLFRYELCSYPAALFDSSLTLRQPQKPVLAKAIWAKLSSTASLGPEERSVCIGWRSSTPSHPVAARVINLLGYLWIILQLCDQEERKRHRRV